MSIYEWFVFYLVLQLIHGLGTWKLYEKAGRKSFEAFIPIYSTIVLMKIINRPTWWTLLLFTPIINVLMIPVVWVETIRSFGKNSTADTYLVLFTLGFYTYYINYTQNVTHIPDRSLQAKTKTGDTISSIVFAIVVATLVHTYVMQPYTIPSSSLEKTLLIGDFLFVSKFHYGARNPMTAVAAPMVHDTLPFIKRKSYLYDDQNENSWKNKFQYPYFRFPGFQEIKNNDIVVFNWPRDTLFHMYLPADRRYDKPIDKKTNYVKRCVGIPGDTLSIIDGLVHINGKLLQLPERAKPQYNFYVKTENSSVLNSVKQDYTIVEGMPLFTMQTKLWDNPIVQEFFLREKVNPIVFDKDSTSTQFFGAINQDIYDKLQLRVSENSMLATMTFEKADKMKADSRIKNVSRYIKKGAEDGIFPDYQDGIPSPKRDWNGDNFGPLYIPKKGTSVSLSKENIDLYKIIIEEYEHNNLKIVGNDIYINDKKTNQYTFQKNYYWMMGDNRHNSLDARYYGYTPDDHIVGKPVFIWMSWDTNGSGFNKIRWERLFTTVNGEGQPQSYFKYFLGLLALYFVGEYFWKKRKQKKTDA